MARLGGGSTRHFLPYGGHADTGVLDYDGEERVIDELCLHPFIVKSLGFHISSPITAPIQGV